ncbi:MAG: hypothetical protein AB7O26_21150 [Planctomycetaceae bacterium]
MQKEIAVSIFLVLGIGIYIWCMWPRRRNPINVSSLPPSFVSAENYFVHCFYHGVTHEDFARTVPDRTFTYLNVDWDVSPYAIAVVTNDSWIGPTKFETTFVAKSGETQTFEWCSPKGKLTGNAVGLFVIKPDMVAATSRTRA